MIETPVVQRLKRRPQFLAVAASGKRVSAPSFTLQAAPRPEAEPAEAIGIGLTATRRLGGAVVRNRARRRLRAAVARTAACAAPGFDYVLIARAEAVRQRFAELERDLCAAFRRVDKAAPRPTRGPRR